MKPYLKRQQHSFSDHTLLQWLRGLALTSLICAGIAFISHQLNGQSYLLNLRISLVFGVGIVIAVNLAHVALPHRSGQFNSIVGFLLGLAIGMTHLLWVMFGNPFNIDLQRHGLLILSNFAMSGLVSLIVFYFFYSAYRVQRLRSEISEQQLLATQKDRELVLSQLKLMQSQIEPHFLFNTLANVQGLIDQDKDTAKRLIGELTLMLRASLKRTREAVTVLDEEIAMARSYLTIQSIRMGGRLDYRIDVPAELGKVTMPPMLVQPLIENAVIHGIEPRAAGGSIDVVATGAGGESGQGAWLIICVLDTGLGLGRAPASHGSGVGLHNVRERLRLLYGDRARLELKPRPEGGTEACLRLPVEGNGETALGEKAQGEGGHAE